MGFYVQLEGFKELDEALVGLKQYATQDQVSRNVLAKAAKEAMMPAFYAAVENARYNVKNTSKPHMLDRIRVDGRKPWTSDYDSSFVKREDAAIGVVSVPRNAVSLANEFGTAKMSAQSFIRSSLYPNIDEILVLLRSSLRIWINGYTDKMSAKARRKK